MFELTVAQVQNTISALKAYNFVLSQISKSRLRTKKERKNAEYDIQVINELIKEYEKILEVLKDENWKRVYFIKNWKQVKN